MDDDAQTDAPAGKARPRFDDSLQRRVWIAYALLIGMLVVLAWGVPSLSRESRR